MSIGWIHLSDLHVREGRPLPFTINGLFKEDLKRMHDAAGPFEFVLFSGDLVNRGTAAEFAELTTWLDKLWSHLEKLGSRPTLIAVPGNHDLERPNPRDPAVRALQNWKADPELQNLFWSDHADSQPYRAITQRILSGYQDWNTAWYAKHPVGPNTKIEQKGLLPGELTASIAHDGLSLGIAGLNSTFLHMADVAMGALTLHPRQLEAVCGGDPGEWVGRHDVNVIVTHHPPNWFDNVSRYEQEIYHPPWFSAHFYGHMHEPTSLWQARAGGTPRRFVQAPSLFGLEQTAAGEKRIFGYTAGRLEPVGTGCMLRIWPRIARATANEWRFIPDYENFQLEQDGKGAGSVGLELPLARKPPGSARRPSAPPPPERESAPPPWAPFDPEFYVPRGIEGQLLAPLDGPGQTVGLIGPPVCGKSTVLSFIVHRLQVSDSPTRVVFISLGRLTDEELADPHAGLGEVIGQVIEACRKGSSSAEIDRQLAELAEEPLAPEKILTALFEEHLLHGSHDRVVLVIDQWERLLKDPRTDRAPQTGLAFVRLLRTWVQAHSSRTALSTERWSRFRLMLAAAGSSVYFEHADEVSEFFNIVVQVRLGHFDDTQLKILAKRYGRSWSNEDLDRLMDLLGGQPYLSRLVMYREANGVPRNELLEMARLRDEHCAAELQQIWLRLRAEPQLFEPLSAMVAAMLAEKKVTLESGARHRLKAAGLIEDDPQGGLRFATPLLGEYMRERARQ